MSFREERLKERIEQIRPQLSKAHEIAEKAEAEGRAMTPEEQKLYSEIMAKGRSVADAVKQHRHDESVFAFARELSDNVIGGLSHDDLSSSGAELKSRRLSFKGLGTKVATAMLGPDGQKALAPSGATVVGQEFVRDPVALGQVAQSLLDVLPSKQHTSAEYAYLAQTTRTNAAAVVGVRPAESVELGTRHGASQP